MPPLYERGDEGWLIWKGGHKRGIEGDFLNDCMSAFGRSTITKVSWGCKHVEVKKGDDITLRVTQALAIDVMKP